MPSDKPSRKPSSTLDHPVGHRIQQLFRAVRRERRDAGPEVVEATQAAARRLEDEKRQAFPWHLAACGVPEKVVRVYRAGVRRSEALKAVLAFMAGERLVCILTGAPGTGKTVAAASALWCADEEKRFMAHPLAPEPLTTRLLDSREGFFVSSTDLAWASPFTSEGRALIERARRVRVLVVDDLGQEVHDAGGRTLEKVEALFVDRDARALKTVITTNAPQEALRERYGARVADRFAQEAVVVGCGEVSLRRAHLARVR
jgi:hypothetical protein